MTDQASTDVVHHAAPDITRGAVQGASLESRIYYAKTLAEAGLVPMEYQRKPANVLYAIETGTMLGIHPIAALNGINVISGKPTISPALMTALVRRAGHKVRIRVEGTVEGSDLRATADVIRFDDAGFTYSATWDIGRAKRAGLWGGRGAWTNYPEAMLKARAIGEVCREAAEDALCGIHYTPEEMGAPVDVEGTVIGAAPAAPPAPPAPPAPAAPAAPPAAETPAPAALPALVPDAVRNAVLDATSRPDLVDRLIAAGAVIKQADGSPSWERASEMKALRVPNRNGEEVTAWELIADAAKVLPAEEPTPPEEPGVGATARAAAAAGPDDDAHLGDADPDQDADVVQGTIDDEAGA